MLLVLGLFILLIIRDRLRHRYDLDMEQTVYEYSRYSREHDVDLQVSRESRLWRARAEFEKDQEQARRLRAVEASGRPE